MNVPAEFRPGIIAALDQALNVLNRTQKRVKFGFSTSEDAITWTVFNWLSREARLGELWRALTHDTAATDCSPDVLLWGVPLVTAAERAWRVRERMEKAADSLGEDPFRRTEPDVVIDAGTAGIVIIEVKYMSSNDVKTPNSKFNRYLDAPCFSDPDEAKATGLYELIRNWRFGCELAQGRRFVLVNLVRRQDLQRERKRMSQFASCLALNDRRQLALIAWESLLDQFDKPTAPALRTFLANRFS